MGTLVIAQHFPNYRYPPTGTKSMPRLTCIRDGVSSRQHGPKRATILDRQGRIHRHSPITRLSPAVIALTTNNDKQARKQVLMALCAAGFMTTALRSSPLGASQPAKAVLGMQGHQAVKVHAMGVKRCRWGHARVQKVSKKLYLWPHSVSCEEPFESWPVFFLKSTVA